ncbi:MAG: AarF/ABC1/UbiB kinase family protein [Devosia sp.]|uniref:ABC1 kinase family protein n=1 Tax=Devosia sp. TaxID=1871048 RepID=UPI001AC93706|nr:AarF/UbiB family protein [Devosia sp.]MBN9310323.1 AarF/ABC1/UbiB kinase family protein [Devosia sp.]MBN9317229.1 AarF/ABC1/UbiB kinase family protein [Devosia sp.]
MLLLRLFQIALEIVRLGWALAIDRLHLSRSRVRPAERLCLSLARLGTTFIKFGQALSLRRDMLPDDYIAALQSLQEHVAPFPAEQAIREIERAFGRPLAELFAEFERKPLAAASIAQVHAARLHDGREVVVKVRRLGIKRQIERDMRALAWLAQIGGAMSRRLRHYQPELVIREIWTNLRNETDFAREARSITRFASAFTDWPTVYVPRAIEGLISETVLVQERSHGYRIDDPAIKSQGSQLAQDFIDLYLHQILVLGVFHGDPHPGNLFITPEGRICFHDFGLVGFLDRDTRRNLGAFAAAFIRQDADWLLDAAIDLGIIGGEIERIKFRRYLAEIISDYAALPLKEWSLAEVFLRVARLGRSQNVLIPYDLVVLMRAMFLAEHAVRVFDPGFALVAGLQAKGPKFLKAATGDLDWENSLDRLKIDAVTAMQDLPAVLREWIRRLNREGEGLSLSLRIDGLKAHLNRTSNRQVLALITLGLYIAASLLMRDSIGPRIYGDMPLLAALGYGLAAWFTFRLLRSIWRSGGL